MPDLPGTYLGVAEKGSQCEHCGINSATQKIQGETDSSGYDILLLCDGCVENLRQAPPTLGICDWCGKHSQLFHRRDYTEGTSGSVYRICLECIHRQNEEAEQYLARRAHGSAPYP